MAKLEGGRERDLLFRVEELEARYRKLATTLAYLQGDVEDVYREQQSFSPEALAQEVISSGGGGGMPDELGIYAIDSGSVDAFGRWRVSDPVSLFDSQLQYTDGSLYWALIATGTGGITHRQNEASVRLSSGNGTCIRETKQHFRYQPGKSQLALLTGVIGDVTADTIQRVGYFSTNNGVFLEQDGTDRKFVLRTYISGAASDANAVTQDNWNIDPMDGTGPSGISLDFANTQIFVFDLQWLGVGRVRCGFEVDGKLYLAHEFLNTNNMTTVYMTTACLPLRWEAINDGAACTVDQICGAVISEGGFENEKGVLNGYGRAAAVSCTTQRAVLSIRPQTNLGGISNRALIEPLDYALSAASNNAYYEIMYNPVFTTGGGALTWTTISNSAVEYCIHGDANNGAITTLGPVLEAGHVLSGAGATRNGLRDTLASKLPITLDDTTGAANAKIPLSIVCTGIGGASSILASINWKEVW